MLEIPNEQNELAIYINGKPKIEIDSAGNYGINRIRIA